MKYPDIPELAKRRATVEDVKAILKEAEDNYRSALIEFCPVKEFDIVKNKRSNYGDLLVRRVNVDRGEMYFNVGRHIGGEEYETQTHHMSLNSVTHLNGEPVE